MSGIESRAPGQSLLSPPLTLNLAPPASPAPLAAPCGRGSCRPSHAALCRPDRHCQTLVAAPPRQGARARPAPANMEHNVAVIRKEAPARYSLSPGEGPSRWARRCPPTRPLWSPTAGGEVPPAALVGDTSKEAVAAATKAGGRPQPRRPCGIRLSVGTRPARELSATTLAVASRLAIWGAVCGATAVETTTRRFRYPSRPPLSGMAVPGGDDCRCGHQRRTRVAPQDKDGRGGEWDELVAGRGRSEERGGGETAAASTGDGATRVPKVGGGRRELAKRLLRPRWQKAATRDMWRASV